VRERVCTDVGVPELVKKRNGIERREITEAGLPAPLGEFQSVGFVVGDAIPALEYLLARSVVPRGLRVGVGIVDPRPIRVVAGFRVGATGLVESEGPVVGMGRSGRGGFSGERENEEDGSEAEEREEWEERDFLRVVVVVSCGHGRTEVIEARTSMSTFLYH
jgi:hypothetical protein